MVKRALGFSILVACMGCEAIATFDRDRIGTMTAPPTVLPPPALDASRMPGDAAGLGDGDVQDADDGEDELDADLAGGAPEAGASDAGADAGQETDAGEGRPDGGLDAGLGQDMDGAVDGGMDGGSDAGDMDAELDASDAEAGVDAAGDGALIGDAAPDADAAGDAALDAAGDAALGDGASADAQGDG